MRWWVRHFLVALILAIFLFGCANPRSVKLPPVTEGWHKTAALKNGYIVQPKDTLYSIAWAFGLDYRYLAAINNLHAPYVLRFGQRLLISAPSKSAKEQLRVEKEFEHRVVSAKPLLGWNWPTSGKIIATFSKKLGSNKGIDIAGVFGQPVVACNQGSVVYSGVGIKSYGKLIIIKHTDDYLSAYAYNRHLLVVEGQEIKAGQKIATMGKNNDGKPSLHFEIRHFGKPVDPLLYLPKNHGHQ